MNYYSHHIGDFDKATRHLTRIERSVYRDLMDVYYDTEQPLTLELPALCRKIIARSNEESTAVEQVLNEFFIETPTGWFHTDIESALVAYRASNSQKSAAGKASAAKKAALKLQALNGNSTTVTTVVATPVTTSAATTVEQTSNGSATNHKPITKNQEPKDMSPPVGADAPLDDGIVEKRSKRRPSEEDYEAARWLFSCQQEVNPEAKKPNFDTWADDVRLLREVDQRSHKDIASLFRFAKKDSFWAPNIQSPGKLRDKWDQLTELRAVRAGQQTEGPKLNKQEQLEADNRAVVARMMEKEGVPQ